MRMRDLDNTLVTESDYDSLMPLGVEVDTLYLWIGYSKHQSKEPNNAWHTVTINH